MNETTLKIRNENLNLLWFISGRWFRILEFSLILGTLHYFKDKFGGLPIFIIYWVSWGILYMWFFEIGELVSDKIHAVRKLKNERIFIWILPTAAVLAIYTIVTEVANSVISAG